MTPKFKFAEGEKVLCFHGPLIYEAKALKSTVTKDKQIKYYIHYAGWNKNWDEWVPENRVLKYNEVNVQRQDELFKQHSSTSGKSKKNATKGKRSDTTKDGAVSSGGSESRASTPSKETSTSSLTAPTSSSRGNRSKQTVTPTASLSKENDSNSKKDDVKDETLKDEMRRDDANKRKRGSSVTSVSTGNGSNNVSASASTGGASSSRHDTHTEIEESFLSKTDVKIKIPDELKQCLADDWNAITRQNKLLDLPAKVTVQDIIDQYIAFKKSSKSTNTSKELAVTDVVNGIIEYFNVMIGSQLLYKFERQQYAEILQRHPDKQLSKIYGAFHLLRLFVKLGSMLSFSSLDEKSMQVLLVHLHDFLKFLVKNNSSYFSMTSFINVSPEYHRNTQ